MGRLLMSKLPSSRPATLHQLPNKIFNRLAERKVALGNVPKHAVQAIQRQSWLAIGDLLYVRC